MPIKSKLKIQERKATTPEPRPQASQEVLSRPIEEIELSVRTANCLWDTDIKTVGDLVKKTEPELLALKNFNKKSLYEIKEVLRGMGLSLGME